LWPVVADLVEVQVVAVVEEAVAQEECVLEPR
jgi:hypothetical protein